jgi:hypothetical protein
MKHLALLALLLAAACGSKSKGPDTTGGGGGGEGGDDANVPTGPLAAGQWDTLDDETRAKFMKNVVLPDMKAKFQAFDAEEFAEFDCKTCHGSGVDSGKFEMPNPELPALTMAEIQTPDEDHKAIVEFMSTQVKPGMATLLGVAEYSQDNPNGFGCMHCHTMEQ